MIMLFQLRHLKCITLKNILKHISYSIFLLMTYYFLFILYLFQTMEMMLDKKQIRVIFLFEFKMGRKTADTTCKSAMHLAQELLTNVQCSGGSRSFAKEMRALKMRSTVPGHRKLAVTNWKQSSKLILLKLHEELPKNSTSTIQPFYSRLAFEVKWKLLSHVPLFMTPRTIQSMGSSRP